MNSGRNTPASINTPKHPVKFGSVLYQLLESSSKESNRCSGRVTGTVEEHVPPKRSSNAKKPPAGLPTSQFAGRVRMKPSGLPIPRKDNNNTTQPPSSSCKPGESKTFEQSLRIYEYDPTPPTSRIPSSCPMRPIPTAICETRAALSRAKMSSYTEKYQANEALREKLRKERMCLTPKLFSRPPTPTTNRRYRSFDSQNSTPLRTPSTACPTPLVNNNNDDEYGDVLVMSPSPARIPNLSMSRATSNNNNSSTIGSPRIIVNLHPTKERHIRSLHKKAMAQMMEASETPSLHTHLECTRSPEPERVRCKVSAESQTDNSSIQHRVAAFHVECQTNLDKPCLDSGTQVKHDTDAKETQTVNEVGQMIDRESGRESPFICG
jgi:hypothetical protein